MKKMAQKIGLLLLSLLAFAPMRGQDTITEGDSCYMFYPHSNPLWVPNINHMLRYNDYYWENIVSPGTLIYGISLRGDFQLDSSVSVQLVWKDKENEYHHYDTAWVDSSAVYRYLKFRAIDNNNVEFDHVDKCNEVYFHRPWQVPDTFYVFVSYGNIGTTNNNRVLKIQTKNESICPQRFCWMGSDGELHCNVEPGMDYITLDSEWGVEFPILEPDRTRCRRPSGLRMRERGDGWAVLQWNSGSGDNYRVTVEGPDDTVVYETADTTLRLDSLAPEAFYWVKLQSLCRYQHYSYDSTLLNPGVLQFGFRNLITGVSGADADLRVEVFPNPASGCLVLEAGDDSPVRAVLTDLGGREVMAVDFRATATLDVSRLAAGPYLLRLTTPAATTVRKVVVQ